MRTLDQIVGNLPPERRAKVMSRTKKLISEEKALCHLRQARDLTQQSIATILGIDQAGVSKIESRSDMLLSTLRTYVEALGGSLKLTVEFADGTVELPNLASIDDRSELESSKSTAKPDLLT